MHRGYRRGPIFRDDADRRRFLETFGEVCATIDWQEGGEAKAEPSRAGGRRTWAGVARVILARCGSPGDGCGRKRR